MISTLIYFDGEYYENNGRENEEQGLAIGGYESAFLAELVASYLFEKAKNIINQITYHGIYGNDGLLVLNGKKIIHKIKYWLAEFPVHCGNIGK